MGLQKAHSALASLGIHHAWAKLPGKSWESTENPMAIPYPASRYDTYVWEWRMLRSYGERRTATQKTAILWAARTSWWPLSAFNAPMMASATTKHHHLRIRLACSPLQLFTYSFHLRGWNPPHLDLILTILLLLLELTSLDAIVILHTTIRCNFVESFSSSYILKCLPCFFGGNIVVSASRPNGALPHRTSGLFHTAALHLYKEPHDIQQLQQPSIHWSQFHFLSS